MATIIGTSGNDNSILGGNDLIGTSRADRVFGLAGQDLLDGREGNDSLDGGEDSDRLTGGIGNDTLNGGSDIDQLVESGNVNFTLTNSQLIGNGTDTLISIENVVLNGGIGDNLLDGSKFRAGNIAFNGGAGDDTLLGGSKNDFFVASLGNNVIDGGFGIDRIQGDAGNGNIVLTNDSLTIVDDSSGINKFTGIELASLIGRNGNNRLDASTFQNSVAFFSGLGNDTLLGGSANDSFTGSEGSDSINGGLGLDRVAEIGGSFFLNNNTLLRLNGIDTDTLTSIETALLIGDASDNTIDASTFLGTFSNGSVAFNGEGGNDTLSGGALGDTLNGGIGTDKVEVSGNSNFVLTNTQLRGNGATDTLISIESAAITGGLDSNIIDAEDFTSGSVSLSGGLGNDILSGGLGSDFLSGEGGNDDLKGFKGTDTLTGGTGSDTLIGFDFPTLGFREFDILSGGTEADTFFLGNTGKSLAYNGLNDHATITDFSIFEGDKIFVPVIPELALGNTDGDGLVDTLLLGSGNNLIAIIQDVNIIGSDVFISPT